MFTAGRGRRPGTTAASVRGQAVTRGKPIPRVASLHLRWQVDPARPWAGVSPLQRAADTGSLSGWLEKATIRGSKRADRIVFADREI